MTSEQQARHLVHCAEADIGKANEELRGVLTDLNDVRLVTQWRRPALHEFLGHSGMGRRPTVSQLFNQGACVDIFHWATNQKRGER